MLILFYTAVDNWRVYSEEHFPTCDEVDSYENEEQSQMINTSQASLKNTSSLFKVNNYLLNHLYISLIKDHLHKASLLN